MKRGMPPFFAPRPRAVVPRGVSLAELLVTIVIVGIVSSLAMPSMSRLRNTMALRSVRQEITATYDAARSAALQRGRAARLIVRGNSVLAVADTAAAGQATSGTYTVLAPQRFDAAYGVTLTSAITADTLIAFDGRGFAYPRLGHTVRLVMTKGTARDSVCITNLGQLLRTGCLQ